MAREVTVVKQILSGWVPLKLYKFRCCGLQKPNRDKLVLPSHYVFGFVPTTNYNWLCNSKST